MIKFFLLVFLVSAIKAADQDWYDLRSTFTLTIIDGFHKEPRTESEAVKDGWIHIGSCDDGSGFLGERYGRSATDMDIVLIYDVNGFIAGVQSVIPKDKITDNNFFNFTGNPMYQPGEFITKEVYYTTAYFVDPAVICQGGRSQEDFDTQGTGYTLLFQNVT